MNERQKRLIEVYDHLRKHYGIHTQSDFADAIRYSRPVISSALNGNEETLTDKLFRNICASYKKTFELDYLLHGEGELLTIEERMKFGEVEQRRANDQMPEYVQKVFDQAVKLVQRSEMLEQQLSLALADNRELKKKLDDTLVAFDGLKQQMAMVLQIFNPQRTVTQFRENFVNDQLINAEP